MNSLVEGKMGNFFCLHFFPQLDMRWFFEGYFELEGTIILAIIYAKKV